MAKELDRGVLTGIWLLAALVVVNAGVSYWNTRKVRNDARWVAHTQEALAALGTVRASARDLEATQRTFILTGADRDRTSFRSAEAQTRAKLTRLAELTTDNPEQQSRIAALGARVDRVIEHLNATVAVRESSGLEAARKLVAGDTGRQLLDDVDRAVDEIEATERALLHTRGIDTERAYFSARLFGAASAGFGLTAVGMFVWLLRRSNRARAAATTRVWEQREWLRTTLASIGDAVIATDLAGNVTLLNSVAEALTGWQNDDAVGRPLTEVFRIVNESTREPVDNPALRALKFGAIVGLANHTILIAKDGTEYPIDDSAAPIRDPDGRVGGAVLVFRDITERKHEEHERERLAETLRLAVGAADFGTWEWNPKTDRISLSDRAVAIYGTDPGPTHTREWMRRVIHPDHRDRARDEAARAVAARADYDIEYPLDRPEPVWVSARGRGVYDEAGELVRMLGVVQDVTARKAAESALRESENRQRFLAELAVTTQSMSGAAEVMAATARLLAEYLDADRCAYAEIENESVFVITGDHPRGVPSIVGRWPVAAFGPECERLMRANEPYIVNDARTDPRIGFNDRPTYEATAIRAVICVPLHKGGRFTAAMAVHTQTPRHWAPEEIQLVTTVVDRCWEALERARAAEAERRLYAEVAAERVQLEEVFQHALSFVAVLRGPALVFERANDRCAELLGGRELIGRPVREAVPEVDGQGFFEILDRVYRTGEAYVGKDARVMLRTGNGELEERVLEFVFQAMRDATGAVSGVLVQGIDLTDHKRAEAELARVTAASERRRRLYETVLSNTPDFVYVFSLDHRVLYANDALIEMWGRGRDGALGKTFLEIGYEPWHAEMHDREIDQVRATKKPIRGEVPFNGTNGRRIYDYIFVPVIGAQGEVEAVAGTTRDVTERQAMEQELRDADQRKDEFIALLAHELRNPLAPIRNGLQVLHLAGTDTSALARTRVMMDRQLSHMVRLVDDLLDASRISRNKMELRRTRVSLSEVMASAVETARPLLDDAGHELRVALPAEPISLDADLTRLAQVFSNLLTNSAKYTPRGGQIHVSAERNSAEAVVSVRDTGIGIPADALSAVFDMFSQVDRSTERSRGGLGIGLALVKGLVEMHGGTVTAESAGPNKGSTFTVRLPIPVDQTELPHETHETGTAPTKRTRRVLVVDDNHDGAESMAEMLGLLGGEVRTAHDGLEAVTAAEEFRPEIILMDVGMPKLNGLDATRRIRSHPWGREMAIVALTGWGQESDRERSRDAGCDGHLVKPVNLSDLEKLLGTLRNEHK
ncbi:PAS domain S-box protein [Gemmata palustris]|nr:PAS domain S-box protein [Gemmata palustris]